MSKPLPEAILRASRSASPGIDIALHLLDQRHDIAHAEDARGHALRIKRRQGIGFFTRPEEHDGLAGDLAHRQGRATARIAIGLGQDDAGEIQRRTEGLGRVHGILARHGVDHEQAFGRRDRGIDVAHLLPSSPHPRAGDRRYRRSARQTRPAAPDPAHRPRYPAADGWPAPRRNPHPPAARAAPAAAWRRDGAHRCSPAAPVCAASRSASEPAWLRMVVLPAPCRPASSTTIGGWARRLKPARAPPISATSSLWMMLTNTCPGVRLEATSVPSACTFTWSMNCLMTGKRHIRLQQRHPDLPQHFGHIVLGNAATPTQGVHGAAEPRCQAVKH